jgi:hypothetical protein
MNRRVLYRSVMSGTLTIQLDPKVLREAEQEAIAHHTTISEILNQQVEVMAQNWRDSQARRTPHTDSLRGAIKLPQGFDEKAALAEELQKRHGV